MIVVRCIDLLIPQPFPRGVFDIDVALAGGVGDIYLRYQELRELGW